MGRPPSDVGIMLRDAFIEHGELHSYGARRVVNQARREMGRRKLGKNYFWILFVIAERAGLIEFVREEPARRETSTGGIVPFPDMENRRLYALVPGKKRSKIWADLPARAAAGEK